MYSMEYLRQTFRIFTGYPGQLSRILGFMNSIDAQLGSWQLRVTEQLRKPSPFVLVFIQAVKVETVESEAPAPKTDYGFTGGRVSSQVITDKPITLSVSGEAPRTFAFQPDVPIANLQIAVICDIRRVRIEDIVVANHHLSPCIEAAPLAYHDGIIGPWNRITIVTSLR